MKVEVRSAARLHLGFYTLRSDDTAYGSIGVAINTPAVVVRVGESKGLEIRNYSGIPVEDEVRKVVKSLGLAGASVEILKAIPRHVGLGSTTQLTLSLAYGLARLYGLGRGIRELAFATRRGWVSGIGIAAFERGGFILDTGRRVEKGRVAEPGGPGDLPGVMYRSPLPPSWRFIVAVPRGVRGLDEREERPLLEAPESDERLEALLQRTVLLGMLPALAKRDVRAFGEALTRLQLLVGEYFSKYQGGVFCCWETETIVNAMLDGGAYGAGQSSWGPTAYGLVRGMREARRVLEHLAGVLDREGIDAEVFVARPRNRGALLKSA